MGTAAAEDIELQGVAESDAEVSETLQLVTCSDDALRNLNALLDIGVLSLRAVWMPDMYAQRTYRYLHYNCYGRDHTKVLEGDIESSYETGCSWCYGCWTPQETEVRINSGDGLHMFSIQLVGDLEGSQPMDTAHIVCPGGDLIAIAKWKPPCLEIYDVAGGPLLTLKRSKFSLFGALKHEKVLCPNTKEVIGSISFSYTMFGPVWEDGYILKTNIPANLGLKHRVAWVSIMFLLKLCHRGQEYARIANIARRMSHSASRTKVTPVPSTSSHPG